LGYYHDHASLDIDVLKSDMVAGLASLSGSWAFILQDRKRHRVVAARSLDGAVPLMWGETSKNCLLFSTTQDSAVSSDIDASPFPPGCVFVSSVADKLYDVTVKRACPGRLVSFAQPPSSGVRRVRSRGSLSRITSGVDLDLIKTFAAGKLRTTPSFSNLFGSANELNAMAEV
jgi:asparagine synthetase B (glutamine-hydrolysing)